MNKSNHINLIVFDVDKTLVKGNLHEILINFWVQKNYFRKLLFLLHSIIIKIILLNFLKRKFEYFIINLIDDQELRYLTTIIITDATYTNLHLLRRITHYKQRNIKVALISAAPSKLIKHISACLKVDFYSSSMLLGVLTNDLLAKKYKIYRKLYDESFEIRSIYSDSTLDFHKGSKSYLIDNDYKCKIMRAI